MRLLQVQQRILPEYIMPTNNSCPTKVIVAYNNFMTKWHRKLILIYAWLPLAVISSIAFGEQQFVFLAKSFLEGKLYLTEIPYGNLGDLSLYNNHYYWPLGPFPAIILLPFVAIFGTNFLQIFLQFPLNILNYFLLFKISKK